MNDFIGLKLIAKAISDQKKREQEEKEKAVRDGSSRGNPGADPISDMMSRQQRELIIVTASGGIDVAHEMKLKFVREDFSRKMAALNEEMVAAQYSILHHFIEKIKAESERASKKKASESEPVTLTYQDLPSERTPQTVAVQTRGLNIDDDTVSLFCIGFQPAMHIDEHRISAVQSAAVARCTRGIKGEYQDVVFTALESEVYYHFEGVDTPTVQQVKFTKKDETLTGEGIRALAVSEDGTILAVGFYSGAVRVLRSKFKGGGSNETICSKTDQLSVLHYMHHTDTVKAIKIVKYKNVEAIITGGVDGVVHIYRYEEPENFEQWKLLASMPSVSILKSIPNSQGSRLWTKKDGSEKLAEVKNKVSVQPFDSWVTAIDTSVINDQLIIAVGHRLQYIKLYQCSLSSPNDSVEDLGLVRHLEPGAITAVSLFPKWVPPQRKTEGKFEEKSGENSVALATANRNGVIRLWACSAERTFCRLRTLKVDPQSNAHTKPVVSLMWITTNLSTRLFTASEDGTVKVWSIFSEGQQLKVGSDMLLQVLEAKSPGGKGFPIVSLCPVKALHGLIDRDRTDLLAISSSGHKARCITDNNTVFKLIHEFIEGKQENLHLDTSTSVLEIRGHTPLAYAVFCAKRLIEKRNIDKDPPAKLEKALKAIRIIRQHSNIDPKTTFIIWGKPKDVKASERVEYKQEDFVKVLEAVYLSGVKQKSSFTKGVVGGLTLTTEDGLLLRQFNIQVTPKNVRDAIRHARTMYYQHVKQKEEKELAKRSQESLELRRKELDETKVKLEERKSERDKYNELVRRFQRIEQKFGIRADADLELKAAEVSQVANLQVSQIDDPSHMSADDKKAARKKLKELLGQALPDEAFIGVNTEDPPEYFRALQSALVLFNAGPRTTLEPLDRKLQVGRSSGHSEPYDEKDLIERDLFEDLRRTGSDRNILDVYYGPLLRSQKVQMEVRSVVAEEFGYYVVVGGVGTAQKYEHEEKGVQIAIFRNDLQMIRNLAGPTSAVLSVAMSSNFIVAGSADTCLYAWEREQPKFLVVFLHQGENGKRTAQLLHSQAPKNSSCLEALCDTSIIACLHFINTVGPVALVLCVDREFTTSNEPLSLFRDCVKSATDTIRNSNPSEERDGHSSDDTPLLPNCFVTAIAATARTAQERKTAEGGIKSEEGKEILALFSSLSMSVFHPILMDDTGVRPTQPQVALPGSSNLSTTESVYDMWAEHLFMSLAALVGRKELPYSPTLLEATFNTSPNSIPKFKARPGSEQFTGRVCNCQDGRFPEKEECAENQIHKRLVGNQKPLDGACNMEPPSLLETMHEDWVRAIAIKEYENETVVISGDDGGEAGKGMLRVWRLDALQDSANPTKLRFVYIRACMFDGPIVSIDVDRDGTAVAVGVGDTIGKKGGVHVFTGEGGISQWDFNSMMKGDLAPNRTNENAMYSFIHVTESVTCVKFSRSACPLVRHHAFRDSALNQKHKWILAVGTAKDATLATMLADHKWSQLAVKADNDRHPFVTSITFDYTDSFLYVGTDKSTIMVFNIFDRMHLHDLPSRGAVNSLDVTRDIGNPINLRGSIIKDENPRLFSGSSNKIEVFNSTTAISVGRNRQVLLHTCCANNNVVLLRKALEAYNVRMPEHFKKEYKTQKEKKNNGVRARKEKEQKQKTELQSHRKFIDWKDSHGDTPLHVAARHGHHLCVKILLEERALLLPNNNNFFPITITKSLPTLEVMWSLRKDEIIKSDINLAKKWSHLHLCLMEKNDVAVEFLLKQAMDPNQASSDNITPLKIACTIPSDDEDYFPDSKKKKHKQTQNKSHTTAVSSKSEDTGREAGGRPVPIQFHEVMNSESSSDDTDLEEHDEVKSPKKNKASGSKKGDNQKHVQPAEDPGPAWRNGFVKKLVEHNANPNLSDQDSLKRNLLHQIAVTLMFDREENRDEYLKIFKDILTVIVPRVDVNGADSSGNTAICLAAQAGNYHFIHYLLKKTDAVVSAAKVDYSRVNMFNHNALHCACLCRGKRRKEIVKLLLEEKDIRGLVNDKDVNGNTPLHLALMNKRIPEWNPSGNAVPLPEDTADVVQLLLYYHPTSVNTLPVGEFLADVDAQNFSKETPLHIAAARKIYKHFKADKDNRRFVPEGLLPEAELSKFGTAGYPTTYLENLKEVPGEDDLESVKHLVKAYCLLDCHNDLYCTPYIVALAWKNKRVVDYLSSVGADIFHPRKERIIDKMVQNTQRRLKPKEKYSRYFGRHNWSDVYEEETQEKVLNVWIDNVVNIEQPLKWMKYQYLPRQEANTIEALKSLTAQRVLLYLKFFPYMLYIGLVKLPIHYYSSGILGVTLSKSITPGLETYDNEKTDHVDKRYWRRLAAAGAICILITQYAAPFLLTIGAFRNPQNANLYIFIFFCFLFGLQSFAIFRASKDRQFFRVNHEVETVYYVLSDEQVEKIIGKREQPKGCTNFTGRITGKIKYLTTKLKFGNCLPVATIVVDFFNYSSFTFLGSTEKTQETSNDQSTITKMKDAMNKLLLEVGADGYVLTIAAIHLCVIIWLMLFCYMAACQMVIKKRRTFKSGKKVERQGFETIINKYNLDRRNVDVLVTLFSQILFATITNKYFQTLDCHEVGNKYLLEANGFACWTGKAHFLLASFGMLGCNLYIQTVTQQMLYFREPRVEGDREIQYIGFFLLVEQIVKTLISMIGVIMSADPSYIFRAVTACLIILLTATVVLHPCKKVRYINFARACVYSCALASVSVSFLYRFFASHVTGYDAVVIWAIICAIVLLVYRGVPKRPTLKRVQPETQADSEQKSL